MMKKENFKKNIIIGAGIAGLSVAVRLKDSSEDFLILEKSPRLGGTWHSIKYKNSLYEFGPNTIIDKSLALRELIKKAGLENELLASGLKQSKRYFYRNNGFLEISASPLKLLFSKIVGVKAKFRIFLEPFINSKSNERESVFDFFSRRFGYDMAQYILSPALQGVWGGDIKQLNMSATMPSLYKLEQEFGSIIKGFLFSKKDKTKENSIKRPQIISFKNGLEELTTKLGEHLGEINIKKNSELIEVEKEDGLYKLKVKRGQNQEFYYCENLIMASPATSAGFALSGISESLGEALRSIYYAPMMLCAYSVKKDLVAKQENMLKAFGFLNCTKNHFTLGTIFASSLFPERELKDEHLFVSFIGGSKNPQIIDFKEEELKAITLNEAKEILDNAINQNIELEDINFIDSKLIAQAIPQYNNNYLKARKIINEELAKHQGLSLAGNYLNGVSIVDTIEAAFQPKLLNLG